MMNIIEYLYCEDKEARQDWEDHVFDNVFDLVLSTLPEKPTEPIWTDGEEILCRTEDMCIRICNALEAITGSNCEIHYHYYDPEEDERNNEVDDHTGWWYVDFN